MKSHIVAARKESRIDWDIIMEALPIGRDPISRRKRAELFNQFDPNGNGILSLAECDKGIRETLGLSDSRDVVFVPALNRAFHAAREIAPPVADFSDDYIDENEFRVFLVYLRHYLELWSLYSKIDKNNDRRVSFREFEASLPLLKKWGVGNFQAIARNPRAAFSKIDHDGGGVVLFDEFAHWALHQGVSDLGDDDKADRADALALLKKQKANLASKGLPGHGKARFSVEQGISGQGCVKAPGLDRADAPSKKAQAGLALLSGALSVEAEVFQWQVSGGSGSWWDMPDDICALLSRAKKTGQNKVEFETRGNAYEADLTRMFQKNIKTGTLREMRVIKVQ